MKNTPKIISKMLQQLKRKSSISFATTKHFRKSFTHRSAKASENAPDGGAKSVQCHIHRELKIEANIKILCFYDRHLLDLICCLRARSLTDEVLLFALNSLLSKNVKIRTWKGAKKPLAFANQGLCKGL